MPTPPRHFKEEIQDWLDQRLDAAMCDEVERHLETCAECRREYESVGWTKQVAAREYALLQTVPGIGENLGLTILYEIGEISRFPTVKDFLSYCRLVKGTVASAGKIKGLRGAKLGNKAAP